MEFSIFFTGRMEALYVLIGEMVYVYYVVLRFRKGIPRLVALVPVIILSFLMPWRPLTTAERILYALVFCWTIMSKLLMLVWDVGPAADPYTVSTFPRFFSAMTFSVHLKRDKRFITSGHQQATAEATEGIPADDDDGKGSRSRGAQSEVPNGLTLRKSVAATTPPGNGNDKVTKNGEANGVQHLEEELQHRRPAKQEEKRSSFRRWVEVLVNSQAGWIVLLRSAFYFVTASSMISMVLYSRHRVSYYVLILQLGFLMYFSILFLFESAAGACACLLGTQVHPQFNMPYLADSLADFWGRRWNLMVNNLLRVSVYEPILAFFTFRDGKKSRRPTQGERAIASFAAFTVSGLMHELIFFYSNKSRPTGEMTAFFVVNGAATILEGFVKPRQRFGMPRLVGWAYTMIFVYLTAVWLFFPPLFRTGKADEALDDLHRFSNWIIGMVMGGQLIRT